MGAERKHRWTPVLTLNLLLGVGTPEPGAILGLWNKVPDRPLTELGAGGVKGGCARNELAYLVPTPSMGSRGWEAPWVRAPFPRAVLARPFLCSHVPRTRHKRHP